MMLKRRILIVLVCNLGFIFLVQLFNHAMTGTSLVLFPYGILVVFAAMNLRFSQGLLIAIITGLWMEGSYPSPFGWFLFLMVLIFALASRLRLRLHRENRAHSLFLGLGLNTFIYLLCCLVLGQWLVTSPLYWLRVAVDLLYSSLVIVFISTWFLEFQVSLLHLVGINIYQEEIDT